MSTVWRWALAGVRGRRVRTNMVGGRRFVEHGDLLAFLDLPQSDAGSAERANAAMRILDGLGVVERGQTGQDTDRKAKA